MEFAAAALTSIATAIAPEAAAATGTLAVASGATTAATGVASFTASAGSILEGALSIGGALAAVRAGSLAAEATIAQSELSALGDELAAGDALTEISVETVQGLERRNSLRRSLIEVLGEQGVATAAGGIDLTFGTPVQARREAVADTERALSVDRQTEQFRKLRLNERAQLLRLQADETRRGGLLAAAGQTVAGVAQGIGIAGGTSLDILRRG